MYLFQSSVYKRKQADKNLILTVPQFVFVINNNVKGSFCDLSQIGSVSDCVKQTFHNYIIYFSIIFPLQKKRKICIISVQTTFLETLGTGNVNIKTSVKKEDNLNSERQESQKEFLPHF